MFYNLLIYKGECEKYVIFGSLKKPQFIIGNSISGIFWKQEITIICLSTRFEEDEN